MRPNQSLIFFNCLSPQTIRHIDLNTQIQSLNDPNTKKLETYSVYWLYKMTMLCLIK